MCQENNTIRISDARRTKVYKVVYKGFDKYRSVHLNAYYRLNVRSKAKGRLASARSDFILGGAIHVYPTLKDATKALASNSLVRVIIQCEVDPLDYIASGRSGCGLRTICYRAVTPIKEI